LFVAVCFLLLIHKAQGKQGKDVAQIVRGRAPGAKKSGGAVAPPP
jgi:hypothetical protein